MRFVQAVLDLVFPPRESERLVRDAQTENFVIQPIEHGGVTALLAYQDPVVKAAIVEAKFQDNRRAQALLGSLLANYIQEVGLSESVLIPVPLSSARRRERGYNQVERICEVAKEALPSLSIERELLVRILDTKPQTALSGSERRENVRNAFMCTKTPDADRTHVVIDDVCTTGATLEAALAAFPEGIRSKVRAVALAQQTLSGTVRGRRRG